MGKRLEGCLSFSLTTYLVFAWYELWSIFVQFVVFIYCVEWIERRKFLNVIDFMLVPVIVNRMW